MTPIADFLICVRFFSRLPVPESARERALGARGFAAAAPMAPVAGAFLALAPAAVLLLASGLRLPPLAAATVAVAVSVILTGALHEDALADCADGFGGGGARKAKLAIMRDSRIGAFGATAIALALLLRVSALAAASVSGRGSAAILCAGTLSRAACLVPLAVLPPARQDGLGAEAASNPARLLIVVGLATGLDVAIAALAGAGIVRAVVAAAVVVLAALGVSALAQQQIGGQTGDVAGATQQVAEIAVLLAFAAGAA